MQPVSPEHDGTYRIVNARNSGILCPDLVEARPPSPNDQSIQSWRASLDHEVFTKDGVHGEIWQLTWRHDQSFLLYNPSTERYANVAGDGEAQPKLVLTPAPDQLWELFDMGTHHLICPQDRPRQALMPEHDGDDAHVRLKDKLPGVDRGWYFLPTP